MKLLLVLTFFLLACSKESKLAGDSRRVEKQRTTLEIPEDLEDMPLPDLELLTKRVVRSEAEIKVAPVRNCLVHNRRKESVPLCLALWSSQSTYDLEIENHILNSFHSSRSHAITVLLKNYSLKGISLALFLETLNLLSEDETWMRAILISRWLSENGGERVTFQQQDQLMGYVLPKENDSPLSFATGTKVILQIRGSKISEVLSSYCRADVEGISAQRCWRVVAASLQHDLSADESEILSSYFPTKSDPSWMLFRRNFPQFKTVTKGVL